MAVGMMSTLSQMPVLCIQWEERGWWCHPFFTRWIHNEARSLLFPPWIIDGSLTNHHAPALRRVHDWAVSVKLERVRASLTSAASAAASGRPISSSLFSRFKNFVLNFEIVCCFDGMFQTLSRSILTTSSLPNVDPDLLIARACSSIQTW